MQSLPSKKLLCLALLLLLPSPYIYAASLTYNGGISGSWTNAGSGWLNGAAAANWNNATPDSAVFAGATPTTVNVDGGVTVSNISVTSGAYTMAGTGTLTLSNTTWDVSSGLTNTVNTALAGTTGLTKTGAGVLSLTGTNKAFTGTVTISNGAILITNALAGNLGSTTTNAITLNGGALYTSFAANTTVNYAMTVGASGGELRSLGAGKFIMASNKLNGSGTLTLTFGTGAGRFDMASTGTTQTNFSGKWVVDGSGGLLDVYAEQNLGTGSGDDFLTLKNGSKVLFRGVAFTKGITIGAGGGQIANSGGGITTISGKISGDATNALLFDLGGNTSSSMTLSSTNNAWLGSTTLSNTGVLKLGTNGVIADAGGNLNVASSGSVFDLNGFSEAIGGLSGTTGIVDNRAASTASVLTVGGNNQSTTFSGLMSNSASGASLALVKTGTGTLTLSGANAYGGGTTLTNGQLNINSTTALGTGVFTIGGGTIDNTSGGAITLANNTQNWNADFTFVGTTNLNLGTGAVTLNANRQVTVNSNQLTVGGAIGGGAYSLTKAGAGNLILSGSNSFSDGTTVRGGRLVASNASALGSGNILVQANSTNRATLVLNGITMTGKTLTMDSTTHRANLLSGGASGATWNGDIVLTGSASANGTTELANDTGNGPLTVAGTITGSISGGALTLRGAGTTVTNVLSASVNIGSTPLTKTDDGTWQITSSGNTWSNTTISSGGGVLSVGNGGATGELGAGNITNNATLVVNRTGAITMTNTISGTGALVKLASGMLTLSGSTANTYAGATTISNGTLQLLKTAGVDAVAGSSLTVSSGAVLLLSASDQVKASTAITLSGGTIQRASGVSEVFGGLVVNSSSTLDFGSGTSGNLTFGTYAPSSLLTVNNFFGGNTLVFGSNLTSSIPVGTYNTSSYTSGDGFFTINSISGGFTTGWNGTSFTITAIPEPSTVIASILLAGLLASGPVGRLVSRRNRAD